MFDNLTTDGLEEAQDTLGGFQPLSTDVYEASIKAAYGGESTGGAKNVTIIADVNGQEFRETIYVTNKKGENFYTKNDKKFQLPGFITVDHICLVATGEGLPAQTLEDKVVNVYDRDAGKEIPKTVKMLTGLIGKKVSLGILHQLEDKTKKEGDQYVPTGETRDVNTIDAVFDPESRMTVVEAVNEADAPVFYDAWIEKNQGQTRDKRSKDGGVQSGRPGSAPAANNNSGTAKPGKSLFGNKKAA